MATVDELLNATTESQVCTIDPDTRVITVPSCYKEFGVEADEKVNRINFQCPKVVGDNIDLTAFNLYINYMNARGDYNAYLVDDVTVSGDNITFSWLLSRHVTEKSGTVNYIVCAKKSDDTGVINEWNTKVATGTVGVGLEATTEVEEQNADVIEQILVRITDVESTQPDWDQITSTKKDYIKNRPFSQNFIGIGNGTVPEVELKDKEANSIWCLYNYSTFSDSLINMLKMDRFQQSYPFRDFKSYLCGGGAFRFTWIHNSGNTTTKIGFIGQQVVDGYAKMIDSVNYSFTHSGFTFYVILDTSTLEETQKDSFPTRGMYVKCRDDLADYPYKSIVLKGGSYNWTRLPDCYLPHNVQGRNIPDPNDYFTTKTVEGALDQIGSQLNSYVKKTEIPVDGTTIKLNDEGQLTLALSNASEVSF